MANDLGTANATLVAQKALEQLVSDYPIFSQIATDFSAEGVNLNQTIIAKIPTVGALQDYSEENGYVANDITTDEVSVTMSEFKHASFAINDKEFSEGGALVLGNYATSLANVIVEGVFADIAALFVSGNYSGVTTVAEADANRATVIGGANAALSNRKVSKNRFGLFSPDLMATLWADTTFVSLDTGGVTINGLTFDLPTVHGVAINEVASSDLPAGLDGIIGAKDSLLIATRTPSEAGFDGLPVPGRISVVTEPRSGLSIQVREFYDIQKGRRQVTYALIWGVAVGRGASAQRIVLS